MCIPPGIVRRASNIANLNVHALIYKHIWTNALSLLYHFSFLVPENLTQNPLQIRSPCPCLCTVQVIIRSHCITSFPESITNLSFSREVLHHVVLRGYIVGPAQKEHLNTLDFEFHHLGSIDAKTPQKDAASEKDHIVDGNFSCSIYTCQIIDQHVFYV